MRGRDLPDSPACGWHHAPGFLHLRPARGPEVNNSWVRLPLVQRRPRCLGQFIARITTLSGVNYVVQSKLYAGACKTPLIKSVPMPFTPPPSPTSTLPPLPGNRWSLQGRSFRIPTPYPSLGRRPPLWRHYDWLRPRCFWSTPGSSTWWILLAYNIVSPSIYEWYKKGVLFSCWWAYRQILEKNVKIKSYWRLYK